MSDYKTFGDIFCGGGGFSLGAVAAGLHPVWAIENDSEVAEVYAATLGNHIIVKNVQDVRIQSLERPDVLLASPPCQQWSKGRSRKLQKRADAEIGRCVLDYVRILKPRLLIIENVEEWKNSESFKEIFNELFCLNYWVNVQILNSVDFGVPQTRRRLFLRASLDGFLPPLPAPVKWIGWYQAIEDLIDGLPESQFAPWQLKRLPKELTDNFFMTVQGENSDYKWSDEPAPAITTVHTAGKHRAFLIGGGNTNKQLIDSVARDADTPAFTVAGNAMRNTRAFLVDSAGYDDASGEKVPVTRRADEPANTILSNLSRRSLKALIVDCQYAGMPDENGQRGMTVRADNEPMFTLTSSVNPTGSMKRPIRAWFKQGRVVSMSSRALARFQSVPDDYDLPDKASLACKVLGNMVPPLMAEKLLC